MKQRKWHDTRRVSAVILLLLFVLSFVLSGCSDASGSSASGVSSQPAAQSGAGGEGEPGGEEGAGEEDEGTPPPAPEGLYAPQEEPQAAAACLLNVETGLYVYEKNADAPLAAASLVKLMTCMLAYEHTGDLDATLVAADQVWVFDELYGKNASTADIRRGETLSVRELLYAALLPSANEAALILANYACSGYMPNFLYMMNQRAKSLGCTGTWFADANGLSEESVTTARDMALIMRAFLKYPELVEIAATASYQMAAHEKHEAPYNIHTTNRLLVQSSPYAGLMGRYAGTLLAGKTGSLGEWQNFASAAGYDGATYVCVVLHSPNAADTVGPQLDPPQSRPALCESAALYTWAFSTLGIRPVLDTGQPATELRVRYSTQAGTVRLMPVDDVKTVLPLEADLSEVKRRYSLPGHLEAPVAAGQPVGMVTLTIGGQVLGTTTLLAEKDVERNQTLYLLQRAGEALGGTYFKVLLVVALVAVGLYAAVTVWLHSRRAPPGQRRRPGG